MEGKLSGLADKSASQGQTEGRGYEAGFKVRQIRKFQQVDRAETPVGKNDSDEEAEVPDPVHDKGFLGGLGSLIGRAIMSDEQVGAEPDQFPENENHDQVVGKGNAEHGKHEDGQAAEVPRLGLVVLHVAQAEDVDQKPDEGNHEEEELGGSVEKKPKTELPAGEPDPGRVP